jgi:peroxiredoxin
VTTTEPSIAEQVGVLQTQMASQAPAEVLAPFQAEQDDLDAAGVPDKAAEPGTAMPDGGLVDAHGRATTLEQARAGQPAVVVFYRGAWCPFCNIALRAYQSQLLPTLTARGVKLVAISPQKPDGSLTAAETNELTFEVLSDAGNQIAGQLGILTRPTDGARASQRALGLDLTAANGDGTDTLPMPTTVLVDAGGVIRWIDVHPNYTTRSEAADILAAVDAQLGRN